MNIHNKSLMRFHKIRGELVKFIRKSRAVTTSEVAAHFKISWNTAEKYLLELFIEKKLMRLKKQGVNIWLLK